MWSWLLVSWVYCLYLRICEIGLPIVVGGIIRILAGIIIRMMLPLSAAVFFIVAVVVSPQLRWLSSVVGHVLR